MSEDISAVRPRSDKATEGALMLSPGWREFIRFCLDLRYGEIERLSIQDGVPVLAETVRKKVRFMRDRGT